MTVTYPLNYARNRLALDIGRKTEEREFKNFRHCMSKTYNSDGIRGFYRGYPISVVGIIAYRGLYFGLYDTFKHLASSTQSVFVMYLIAQSVTLTAGILTYPLDTVKNCMMLQSCRKNKLYTGSSESSPKALNAIKHIWKNYGIKGFYGGLLVNIGTGTGGAIALVLYDALMRR